MPAIHPARLKQQAILVAQQFDDPPGFVRSLHHLLDYYSDRASRPGQIGKPPPLLASYRVKPPVLRQVLLELLPLGRENPPAGYRLCDTLWEQPNVEFRLLAASLLGELTVDDPAQVLRRVTAWASAENDLPVLDGVLRNGCKRLRSEHSALVFHTVEGWLADKRIIFQRMGLRALLPITSDPSYPNLPHLHRLVQPFVRHSNRALRPDILDVLTVLAGRYPVETASFLRQTLTLPESPDAAWMVRQLAAAFPPEQEARLRSAVRGLE